MDSATKKRIGILRGGTSGNYEASLREGGDLIVYIFEKLYDRLKPVDVFIDKNEVWHIQGVPIKPVDLVHKVDVVWDTTNSNASVILEGLNIPRVGVKSFSSLLQTHRPLLEEYLKVIGVNMPKSILLPVYQQDFDGPREQYAIKKAQEVFEKFSSPWIVRSYPPDADMGVHVAKTFTELVGAIEDGVNHGSSILVEELITGKITTMHSIADFRGEEVYHLPLITVSKGNATLANNFSQEEKIKLTDMVRNIYKHIGATHYLGSSFVVNPNRGPFVTSVLFSPDLRDPHFIHSCDSIGIKPHDIFHHIVERAQRGN